MTHGFLNASSGRGRVCGLAAESDWKTYLSSGAVWRVASACLLSTNRKFLKIIDRFGAGVKREGAISAGKLRRRLGLGK
jgi:cytidylate kinase